MGFRRGLIEALNRAGISYSLWDPVRKESPGAAAVLTRPLPRSAEAARKTAGEFLQFGPFSHVIAAGESSVFPASHARRVLGCRLSKHSVVRSCSDKLVMKTILSGKHIPMTPFIAGPQSIHGAGVLAEWQQAVLKDTRSSGGRGIRFITHKSDMPTGLESGQLLEKFVDAPECSIESFVHDGKILFTNITEYYRKRHTNIVPASFAPALTQSLLDLNQKVIHALQLSWGMTHMEAYLTGSGPLFGEIALRPPGGYIMDLLSKAYGFDAWQAFLQIELGNIDSLSFGQIKHPAPHAVTVLHPGKGRVVSIQGWDSVKTDPSVSRAKLKVKPGDEIVERIGAGEDIGYIFQTAATRDELAQVVDRLSATLQIEMQIE